MKILDRFWASLGMAIICGALLALIALLIELEFPWFIGGAVGGAVWAWFATAEDW